MCIRQDEILVESVYLSGLAVILWEIVSYFRCNFGKNEAMAGV